MTEEEAKEESMKHYSISNDDGSDLKRSHNLQRRRESVRNLRRISDIIENSDYTEDDDKSDLVGILDCTHFQDIEKLSSSPLFKETFKDDSNRRRAT